MQSIALPDGLAATPPGPELGALLAGIDPARVANGDLVTVLQAWRRQRSHGDAAELAVLAEVGCCDPHSPPEQVARLEAAHPGCGIEIAAALTLTELSAWREHALAEALVRRLPAVHTALAAGHIDRVKAMVFADLLDPLTDDRSARVCAALLPKAPRLTTGQLRARLRRMVLAIDPGAAHRRYQRALRGRRVICYLDQDGTATLAASGLDPTAAQAASERLDGLARALRSAGHPETLPVIRADLATALLDGSLHTLGHDEIVAVMLARAAELALDAGGAGPSPDDDLHRGAAGADSDTAANDDNDDNDHSANDGDGDDGTRDGGGGARRSEPARPGIEIRIRLSTLLGRDDHPGEVPGLGPVLAPTARAGVARHRHAEWRFAITDDDGHLVLAGSTRRRPPPDEPAGRAGSARPAGPGTHGTGHPPVRQAHGGTVEIQVPATLLSRLSTRPPPGWEPLIADLAARYARRAELGVILDQRSGERFPCPALRRHVEVRDRTCVFPGCRRPARKAQQDHTHDHRHGGPTVRGNLGSLCVLHHALKTAGLWRVQQPEPGVFRWRSPLHRVYVTRGEPVCPPLPDPEPGAAPEAPVSTPASADTRDPTATADRAPPARPPF